MLCLLFEVQTRPLSAEKCPTQPGVLATFQLDQFAQQSTATVRANISARACPAINGRSLGDRGRRRDGCLVHFDRCRFLSNILSHSLDRILSHSLDRFLGDRFLGAGGASKTDDAGSGKGNDDLFHGCNFQQLDFELIGVRHRP